MTGSVSLAAAAVGAALAAIGAAVGIGRLAAAAMEGTARQPSAGGDIRLAMMLAASFIEGAAMFALIICAMVAAGK